MCTKKKRTMFEGKEKKGEEEEEKKERKKKKEKGRECQEFIWGYVLEMVGVYF